MRLSDIRDAFQHFSRNLRWGTCGECPENFDGIYPEFCINTQRYDHQLKLDSLCEEVKRHAEFIPELENK